MAGYERVAPRGQARRVAAHPGPRVHPPPGYTGPRARMVSEQVSESSSATQREEDEVLSETGFGGGKTVLVLCIVAGCFAVLWPKIFVPMLFGEMSGAVKTDDDGERMEEEERKAGG